MMIANLICFFGALVSAFVAGGMFIIDIFYELSDRVVDKVMQFATCLFILSALTYVSIILCGYLFGVLK